MASCVFSESDLEEGEGAANYGSLYVQKDNVLRLGIKIVF